MIKESEDWGKRDYWCRPCVEVTGSVGAVELWFAVAVVRAEGSKVRGGCEGRCRD